MKTTAHEEICIICDNCGQLLNVMFETICKKCNNYISASDDIEETGIICNKDGSHEHVKCPTTTDPVKNPHL